MRGKSLFSFRLRTLFSFEKNPPPSPRTKQHIAPHALQSHVKAVAIQKSNLQFPGGIIYMGRKN